MLLCLCSMFEPVIIDSTIYQADIEQWIVREHTLSEMIIDYVLDDFLYVLTPRYLNKLDTSNLAIIDRIPLPQRFNYLTASVKNIALIAPNEITLIDKNNLAFKAGIGIEHGDYRPLLIPTRFNPYGQDVLYLITDRGRNSRLKVINLQSGEILRTVTTGELVSFECDCVSNTISVLDKYNRVTVFDAQLHKKRSTMMKVDAYWFTERPSGYYTVGNQHGIFLASSEGEVIDFQPVSIIDIQDTKKPIVLADNGILVLDSCTMRPQQFVELNGGFDKILKEKDASRYAVALDTSHHFYSVDMQTKLVNLLPREIVPLTKQYARIVHTDSLWYFQIGAFTTLSNALDMYNALNQSGLPVFIDTSALYRIQLGGFTDKVSGLELIENAGLDGWFVYQQRRTLQDSDKFVIGQFEYIREDGIIKRSSP